MNALAAGIVAGLAVAIPLGAIGVLIVDLGVRGGFRPAFLAGLGTALADGLYATVAAVAGLAVGAWLAPAERAIALAGARRSPRSASTASSCCAARRPPARSHRPTTASSPASSPSPRSTPPPPRPSPASSSACRRSRTPRPRARRRRAGAFGASLAWQSTLAGGGALMRHGLPPSARTWSSIAGRVLVLALAAKLALGA